MKLCGKIIAADSTNKTITILCDTNISGIQIAGKVILTTDDWPFTLNDKERRLQRPVDRSNPLVSFKGLDSAVQM